MGPGAGSKVGALGLSGIPVGKFMAPTDGKFTGQSPCVFTTDYCTRNTIPFTDIARGCSRWGDMSDIDIQGSSSREQREIRLIPVIEANRYP